MPTHLPVAFHSLPMLSLRAIFDAWELKAWATWAKGPFIVQPKADGVALELIYQDGILAQAILRGDGHRGEVVTENASRIDGVPSVLPESAPHDLIVRGEVVMLKAHVPDGAHGRHLVAAALRSGRLPEGLLFLAHGAPALDTDTELEAISALRGWGFTTPRTINVSSGTLDEWVERGLLERLGLDYDCDGVVVKVYFRERQRELGYTRTAPRWAVACKWEVVR